MRVFIYGVPTLGKIAVHLAYVMFSVYQDLIIDLVFFRPRFVRWGTYFYLPFNL